ncbi:MAG: restriction endonuclease [Trichloromonadaceae bacterium]
MNVNATDCITKLADDFGYTLYVDGRLISLHDERSYFSVNFEFTESKPDTAFVYLYVRTTSWDLPGERTDANEFISMMLGVFLRVEIGVSPSLWDIPHPAIPAPETEIYARYVVVDQPFGSEYSLDDRGIKNIGLLLRTIRQFELIMPHLFDWTIQEIDGKPVANPDYGWTETVDWARAVASAIRESWDEQECPEDIQEQTLPEYLGALPQKIQFNWRRNPDWKYHRSVASGITVYEIPGFASAIFDRVSSESPWQVLDGVHCKLCITDETCNVIPIADFDLAQRILRQLNDGCNTTPLACIPLEHDLIVASRKHIVFLRRETGRKRFATERESIRKRHQRESSVLFPILNFEWQPQIDDQQFEEMILDLLKREPGVQRARLVSGSTEPDGGRDILCEWHTPPSVGDQMTKGVPPSALRKVIVQCKAYNKAVNKSNVQDIRDTVEHNDADGYFLVVSSHLTTPLTDQLDRLRQRGTIWVDWWTRSELEERLAKHQDIAKKYKRVVACN